MHQQFDLIGPTCVQDKIQTSKCRQSIKMNMIPFQRVFKVLERLLIYIKDEPFCTKYGSYCCNV